MRALLIQISLVMVSTPVVAAEFIEFSPPSFLSAARVSRAALGATYAYRGKGEFSGAELQITVAALPPEIQHSVHNSPAACVEIFLNELRHQSPGLFSAPVARPLLAGPLALTQVRWTREMRAKPTTGVTACTIHNGRFVVVNFAAATHQAMRLLTRIRLQLTELKINF